MKKLLLSVLAVVGVLILLPFTTGILAKRAVVRSYLVSSQLNDYAVSWQVSDYQRGWFSSTATLKMVGNNSQGDRILQKLAAFKDPKSAQVQDLRLTIHHGPVLFNRGKLSLGLAQADAKMNFYFNPEITKVTQEVFGDQPYLTGKLKLSLMGETQVDLNSVAIHYRDHNAKNAQFDWDGFTANVHVAKNQYDSRVSIRSAPMLLKDDLSTVKIDQIDMKAKTTKGLPYLAVGNFDAFVKSVLIVDQLNHERWDLSDLNFQLVTQLMGSKYSMSTSVDINNANVNDRDSKVKLDIGVASLDAQSLSELLRLQRTTKQPTSQTEQFALVMKMLPLMEKTFEGAKFHAMLNKSAKDANVFIKLELEAPEKIDITHGGAAAVVNATSGNAEVLISKKLVKQLLTIKSERKTSAKANKNKTLNEVAQQVTKDISRPFAPFRPKLSVAQKKAYQQQLQESVAKGLITEQKDIYITHISLKSGKVYLNGHEAFNLFQR